MVSSRTSRTTLYDRKIEDITTELPGSHFKNLLYSAGDNASIIIDYITIMKTEVNYSNHYGMDTIGSLCRFSKYHKNKPFKDITRNDIIEFLNSLRKTETQSIAQVDRDLQYLYRLSK